LLEQSRTAFATGEPFRSNGHELSAGAEQAVPSTQPPFEEHSPQPATIEAAFSQPANLDSDGRKKKPKKGSKEDEYANRQPITDVLHDIYDRNIG
jgi:hypothetical protein